jgi:hypothetical protein
MVQLARVRRWSVEPEQAQPGWTELVGLRLNQRKWFPDAAVP